MRKHPEVFFAAMSSMQANDIDKDAEACAYILL